MNLADVRFCSACGVPTVQGARYCASCGVVLPKGTVHQGTLPPSAPAGATLPAPLAPPAPPAPEASPWATSPAAASPAAASPAAASPAATAPAALLQRARPVLPYRPDGFRTLAGWTEAVAWAATALAAVWAVMAAVQVSNVDRFWGTPVDSFAERQAVRDYLDMQDSMAALAGLFFLVAVAVLVLLIVLLFRATKQAAAAGATELPHRPGWAIAGWFVPIANLFVPFRMMWAIGKINRSDASIPLGNRWKQAGVPGAVLAAWIALPLGYLFSAPDTDSATTQSADIAAHVMVLFGVLSLLVLMGGNALWARGCRTGLPRVTA